VARPKPRRRPAGPALPRWLLLLLFTLSGISGLIYQVIWARQLTLVFGATSPAITTVLTSFMLGLALGSYGAGRSAGRWGNPLRAYACIELGIGAYGLVFPFLLDLLKLAYLPLFQVLIEAPLMLGMVRFVLVVVLLLSPTVLMGASLPVLARALIQEPLRLGREAGTLYGVNTLGAAGGVYLSTFFLIPWVGLIGGGLSAAALNWAVAGTAWAYARRWRGEAIPQVMAPVSAS
jgi:spermidine synthase